MFLQNSTHTMSPSPHIFICGSRLVKVTKAGKAKEGPVGTMAVLLFLFAHAVTRSEVLVLPGVEALTSSLQTSSTTSSTTSVPSTPYEQNKPDDEWSKIKRTKYFQHISTFKARKEFLLLGFQQHIIINFRNILIVL